MKKLYIKKKIGKGNTIFTKEKIKKDEVIFKVEGKLINKPTLYSVPINYNLFIDPVPDNNIARYLCHDCEPNSGIKDSIFVVAMRDIEKDEEICIDYGMIVYEYSNEMTPENYICKCGKKGCRGFLGSYKELPEELKKKYKKYTSDYLLK